MREDRMVCPNCGSAYFATARREPRAVFHVYRGGQVDVIDDSRKDGEVDPAAIHCGACSFSGSMDELVAGR